MNSFSYRALFDELGKIATAGDLMNPAVVSDSAVVEGPTATPFTRRRGFRKLEQTGPVKEAGARSLALRLVKKVKRVGKLSRRGWRTPGTTASVLYNTEVPSLVRAVTDPIMMDPSSAAVPNPITKLFGL